MSSPEAPAPKRNGRRIAVAVGVAAIGLGVAIAVYALRHGPDRDEALLSARSGKFTEAEPALVELAGHRPDDPDVREALAKGYIAAEKYVEAEPHANRLVELKPGNPDYLRLRIKVHKELAHFEAQYADTIRLLDLEPTEENRKAAMIQAYSTGRFPEAEQYCQALLKEAPKDRSLRSRMANIRRALGDDDGGALILDELIREDPTDYGAKFSRGVLYDETGHSKEAIGLLRDVYEHDPTRRRTSGYQLALALGKAGDQAEADKVMLEVRRLQDVEVYGTAMKNRPDDLGLQVRIAETMIKDGHTADGVGLLEAVLKKDPAFTPAHRAMAAYYEKQGDAERAAHHRRLAAGGK